MSPRRVHFAGVERGTSAAKAESHEWPLNAGLKARTTRADFSIFQQPVKPCPNTKRFIR